MGLYDIMDDITLRQINKTETGDNRIFGVLVGTVTANFDDKKEHIGEVCVEIPVRDKDANVLKWAKIATLASGKNWGTYWVPEVGDEVLVIFEQGNIEKPYVIGSVPKADSKMLDSADQNNKNKDIKFQYGTYVHFEDDVENEGEKDKFKLSLSDKAYIEMSKEKEDIIISDYNKKNYIRIQGGDDDGKIKIVAEKKIELQVGTDMSLILNGESGTATLKCKTFNVNANGNIDLKADGSFKGNGQVVKIEAGNVLTIQSSGPAKVAGTPINLG